MRQCTGAYVDGPLRPSWSIPVPSSSNYRSVQVVHVQECGPCIVGFARGLRTHLNLWHTWPGSARASERAPRPGRVHWNPLLSTVLNCDTNRIHCDVRKHVMFTGTAAGRVSARRVHCTGRWRRQVRSARGRALMRARRRRPSAPDERRWRAAPFTRQRAQRRQRFSRWLRRDAPNFALTQTLPIDVNIFLRMQFSEYQLVRTPGSKMFETRSKQSYKENVKSQGLTYKAKTKLMSTSFED